MDEPERIGCPACNCIFGNFNGLICHFLQNHARLPRPLMTCFYCWEIFDLNVKTVQSFLNHYINCFLEEWARLRPVRLQKAERTAAMQLFVAESATSRLQMRENFESLLNMITAESARREQFVKERRPLRHAKNIAAQHYRLQLGVAQCQRKTNAVNERMYAEVEESILQFVKNGKIQRLFAVAKAAEIHQNDVRAAQDQQEDALAQVELKRIQVVKDKKDQRRFVAAMAAQDQRVKIAEARMKLATATVALRHQEDVEATRRQVADVEESNFVRAAAEQSTFQQSKVQAALHRWQVAIEQR